MTVITEPAPATQDDAEPADRVLTVFQYGCPASYDLPDEGITQLRLGNRLWNRHVEIHRDHDETKARIWVTDPRVAEAQAAVDVAEKQLNGVYERIREARKADRTTVPRDEDKADLATATRLLEAAREVRDKARDAARPGLRDLFAAAKKIRNQAARATYAEYTQAGLGWGTWNDIARPSTGRIDRAVKKVEQERMQGRRANLHFQRFDGTGTLNVQVMGGTGIPPRTIPALNSGTHTRSEVVRIEPWSDPVNGRPKGEARLGTMHLTIGRAYSHGPVRLAIPVVLDRYIPEDAEVCEVKVTRFRRGTRYRIQVSVVCSVPAPAPAPQDGPQIAVRLDWRAAGDGWVRVAHIASSDPLPPMPAAVAEVTRVNDDGRTAEVFCTPRWRKPIERSADIRSIRDQNLDILKTKLAAMIRDTPALEQALGVPAADLARWRSPARFAVLAQRAGDRRRAQQEWKDTHPISERGKGWRRRMLAELDDRFRAAGPALELLAEWRSRDRHLWEYQDHEGAQVLASRKDTYRCVAAWLTGPASAVIIDGQDLVAARAVPSPGHEDPEAARGSRRLAHMAAPGELRETIKAAAGRRGVPVTEVKPKPARKTRKTRNQDGE